jgi:alginate O-acetyltransferase complex protein AlgI
LIAVQGPAAAQGNLWITMLVSGLWHGAAWTFVIWGAVHAALLSLERLTKLPQRMARVPGGTIVTWTLTLLGVMVAWVFFRAESAGQAFVVLGRMFSASAFDLEAVRLHYHWRDLLLVLLVALRQACFFPGAARWPLSWPALPRVPVERMLQPVAVALLLWACIFLRGPGHACVCFQF